MKSWLTEGKLIEIHILGHLTPPASLGLESFPYYSNLVPEWCQQSPSGWMWVCVTPCSSGFISSEAAFWYWPHHYQGGKSANLHCEAGNLGLQSLSQEFGTFLAAEMPWGEAQGWEGTKHPAWEQEGYFTVGFPVTLHSPAREGTLLLVHLCFHRPLIKPRWICVVRIK